MEPGSSAFKFWMPGILLLKNEDKQLNVCILYFLLQSLIMERYSFFVMFMKKKDFIFSKGNEYKIKGTYDCTSILVSRVIFLK